MQPRKIDVHKLAAAKWASSGLTAAQAKVLKLRALTGAETQRLSPTFHAVGALYIPYFTPSGKTTDFYRIRYVEDLPGFAGATKKPQRYAQTPGSLNEVYLPPVLDQPWIRVLKDTETALYITEGELKAAAACARGLPTLGLGGVDVWRSAKRKVDFLPELERIAWKGRRVVILFDSDAATNVDVVRAQRQLSKALLARGAVPVIAALPAAKNGGKQGLDDYLLSHSTADLLKVVTAAVEQGEVNALWEMNEEVVFVRDPGLVVERASNHKMAPQLFTGSVYANRSHVDYSNGDKPKRVPTAKKWLEWGNRFEASKLIYSPGQPQMVNSAWNLWTGWGVEPKRGDMGPWNRLLDFIFRNEPASREWFERWCAYPLQHPGTKLFTSAVIWGVVHGTGKTLMGYTLRDIYGSNGLEIKNHHLSGNFNEWAANKQFIIGDEITGNDKRVEADRLKGLVTQEEAIINAKFLPSYRVQDCVNYYFTSNNPDAFFLDDTDRRFFVHEVVGNPADAKLYAAFDKWRRAEGPAALFQHLLDLKLGDFHPKAHALVTRAKEEMTYTSKSDLGAWCRELIRDPTQHLRPLGETVAKRAELVTASQLLRCYDPEGANKRVTPVTLGRELRRCGLRQLPVVWTPSGTTVRLYSVRNSPHWDKAALKDAAKHWEELFGAGAKKF